MCGLHLRCSTPKQTQAIQDDTLLFLLLLLLAAGQVSRVTPECHCLSQEHVQELWQVQHYTVLTGQCL